MSSRVVLNYLVEGKGLYVVENDNYHGPDLIVFSGFRKPLAYVEVSVDDTWKVGIPITVRIPTYKQDYTQAGLPIDFWVLQKSLKKAVIVSDKVLLDSPVVDDHYEVSVDRCSIEEFK